MLKAMVYGAGMSGLGAQKLLQSKGYEVILVDDKRAMTSKEALKYIGEISLFVKSPGIPYTELVLKAKEVGIEIIDELELAYREIMRLEKKPKIIAVTGTNGKTTVTTKLKELLEFTGKKARFAGNIGVSFSNLVLDLKAGEELDYVILEMSSYQLENIDTFKADIAMVINLAPDHLDRYDGEADYYNTKMKIGINQGYSDTFIINLDSSEVMKRLDCISGKKITVSKKQRADIMCKDNKILVDEIEVADSSRFALKGEHNLENQLFIIGVAKLLELDDKAVREFLYNTGSLEHRMEEFYRIEKTLFVNDSKGTNLESTLMAVGAYERPIVILGGVDKKLDLKPLVKGITGLAKEIYLIGDIADELEQLFIESGYNRNHLHNEGELDKVIEKIKKRIDIREENIVLFSPATASFDQFKNYLQRGEVFKNLVKNLFKKGEQK